MDFEYCLARYQELLSYYRISTGDVRGEEIMIKGKNNVIREDYKVNNKRMSYVGHVS